MFLFEKGKKMVEYVTNTVSETITDIANDNQRQTAIENLSHRFADLVFLNFLSHQHLTITRKEYVGRLNEIFILVRDKVKDYFTTNEIDPKVIESCNLQQCARELADILRKSTNGKITKIGFTCGLHTSEHHFDFKKNTEIDGESIIPDVYMFLDTRFPKKKMEIPSFASSLVGSPSNHQI